MKTNLMYIKKDTMKTIISVIVCVAFAAALALLSGCTAPQTRTEAIGELDEALAQLFEEGAYYDLLSACRAHDRAACNTVNLARQAAVVCFIKYPDNDQAAVECTVQTFNSTVKESQRKVTRV